MNDHGFTLLETLVALMILSMSLVYVGAFVRLQIRIIGGVEGSERAISSIEDLNLTLPELSVLGADCIFDVASRQCRQI